MGLRLLALHAPAPLAAPADGRPLRVRGRARGGRRRAGRPGRRAAGAVDARGRQAAPRSRSRSSCPSSAGGARIRQACVGRRGAAGARPAARTPPRTARRSRSPRPPRGFGNRQDRRLGRERPEGAVGDAPRSRRRRRGPARSVGRAGRRARPGRCAVRGRSAGRSPAARRSGPGRGTPGPAGGEGVLDRAPVRTARDARADAAGPGAAGPPRRGLHGGRRAGSPLGRRAPRRPARRGRSHTGSRGRRAERGRPGRVVGGPVPPHGGARTREGEEDAGRGSGVRLSRGRATGCSAGCARSATPRRCAGSRRRRWPGCAPGRCSRGRCRSRPGTTSPSPGRRRS